MTISGPSILLNFGKMDKKDEEEDVTHEFISQKEEDVSEDDNSDNDSVDSAQLLADIIDVLNSSDVDFPHKKSESNITVSYLDRDHSAGKTSDKSKAKHRVIQDVGTTKHGKTVPGKGLIASSCNDGKRAAAEHVDLSSALEKNQDAGPPITETFRHVLKEPVVRLTRLDMNLLLKSQSPLNLPGSAQSLAIKADCKGDSKARRKAEIKKSAWYEEDSPLSDISVSDVSDAEDGTSEQKSKGMKDRISVTHDKNSKSNSSRHKTSEKDNVSEENGGYVSLSNLKPKVFHSNQNSTPSQSKKNTTSGVKISNPNDRPKANDISLKNTDKDRKVTEKAKSNSLTDSRKRRASKDDGGIDTLSQPVLKHQRVTSSMAKRSGDSKRQGVSLFKDQNQKLSSVETKKTMDGTKLSKWRYELYLSPVDIDDLSNESFRKFINLASDCAIKFDSSPQSHQIDGHVNLYFGTAPQMQSGMQKLCQLSLVPPKMFRGFIKCRLIEQVAKAEADVKWKCAEEVKLGFSMFSTWTEKVKHLVQGKGWKREDESKRKFAQIQRIPPIVSKEMISLLFPFSHNVHIPKPNAGDQKRDSSGYTSVGFENTAWMETILSCFRDFYVAKSGSGNPVWKLRIMNFTPRPEKIPARPVTGNQGDSITKNLQGPKAAADSTPKDKSKDFTALKPSDRYQGKASKEATNASGKDDRRKRSFPGPDGMASGGRGPDKKRRPSEGISSVRDFDHSDKHSPQNAETDNSNLKVLAQSRGLDPNNVDVLRILEVQNQLTSLQALFSCSSMEDTGSLHGGESSAPGKSQGGHKLNPERDMSANPNRPTSISEAEKQLRENIAKKQKQLRELEEKLQQKRPIQKDNTENQLDGSIASIAACLNDEPLDFTKPVPKIEEAVKKDEEHSKMFASKPSTSFPLHPKGKRDNQKEPAITAEDFALPLQFGKNVSKVALDKITQQTDKKTREREDNRHSANRSDSNRSDQRKRLNERHPPPKGPSKGSPSNVAWNKQRQKRNFDEGKRAERTHQGQFKERGLSDSDRLLPYEGSSESKGSRNQESFRPGQNRPHQNFDSSHNRSFGLKANIPHAEADKGRYPGPAQRSHMTHEKLWQEDPHVETRQFPEGVRKSDSEVRRAQSMRNAERVRRKPENEYWDEFEDADYNMSDKSFHGNRQDDRFLFRENVQPEKYNQLRKSSEPLSSSYGNQQTGLRESPRRFYERQPQGEIAHEKCFGNAWTEGDRFEDVSELEHSGQHYPETLGHMAENTDIIPPFDSEQAFDQKLGFQENLRIQGSSSRGRGIVVRGRAGMEMRGRGSEFQRGGAVLGKSTEPPTWADERGRGFEFSVARGRDSDIQIGRPDVGRGTQPLRGFGMIGRGHEPQRSAAAGGRGSEFERGVLGGRDAEPPRGFGMRGRGRDPETGIASGGGEAEPMRSFGMSGRGHELQRGAIAGENSSELQRGGSLGGKGAVSLRGFGMRGRGLEPVRGAKAGGRGLALGRGGFDERGGEPPRGFGMRGTEHEPQVGGPMDERDINMESPSGLLSRGRGGVVQRGRSTQPQRGRGADLQRGIEMRTFMAEHQVAQNVGDSEETSLERGYGIRGRGRGILRTMGAFGRGEESQSSIEIEERSFEGGRGAGPRGRGMQGQRGRGMRGRGNEIQQRPDMNERNYDMREGATEILQGNYAMRGRGGHPQRGSVMGGNGQGLNPQRGSMAGRGRGFQNNESFSNVRVEQSAFEEFGYSEESFYSESSGGESFAPIPVVQSNTPRGRGQSAQRQRGRMPQGRTNPVHARIEDRLKDFAYSLSNQEPPTVTDFQRAGNNSGRGRQNSRDGFEHGQSRMQEENSSLNAASPAIGNQRGGGRGLGFGASPRGRGMSRGRGFMGPPDPGPSNNLGGNQPLAQRGRGLAGSFGGRGNFSMVEQNDRRPQGRGGHPPGNFMARGDNRTGMRGMRNN